MPQTRIQTLPLRTRTGLVARIRLFLAAITQRRRTRASLSRLDPHLLRDVGLDDSIVADECAKPFWRS
jgi:uncharacterized protein YjiS (DUF1127 family)